MTTKPYATGGAAPAPGEPGAARAAPSVAPGQPPHATSFVEAAVALARTGTEDGETRQLCQKAGAALVRLGELGASEALAEALRPDPDGAHALFTVACYQIGDLVPCSLRDYRDPAEAVQALAGCPEPSHVAAELLASSASGLRWSALARMGEEVTYQPLTAETASCAATASPDPLHHALAGWGERLAQWAALARREEAAAALLGEGWTCEEASGPGGAGDAEALLLRILEAVASLEARLRATDGALGEIQARLSAIEQRLAPVDPC